MVKRSISSWASVGSRVEVFAEYVRVCGQPEEICSTSASRSTARPVADLFVTTSPSVTATDPSTGFFSKVFAAVATALVSASSSTSASRSREVPPRTWATTSAGLRLKPVSPASDAS